MSGVSRVSLSDRLHMSATSWETSSSGSKSINKAVSQVLAICADFTVAATGKSITKKPEATENVVNDKANALETKPIMSRVKSGLLAVAALGPAIGNVAVRAAGKGLDKLVDKHPVLAMALGVAGLIGGIILATHEPFTGIALTTAAAYTILKSYKPVHNKLTKMSETPATKTHEEAPQAKEVGSNSFSESSTKSVVSENEPEPMTATAAELKDTL